MSSKLFNRAWRLQLPPTERVVLMAMAEACDLDSKCQVSLAELIDASLVSERTVQRCLRLYEELGFVNVIANHNGGPGKVRVYKLTLPAPHHSLLLPGAMVSP